MKRARAGGLMFGVLFAVGIASCSGDSSESAETAAVTVGSSGSGSGSCDRTPIDGSGTLPACAAGTPGSGGPGVPEDFAGSNETSMPITAADQAAIAAAQALDIARNPPGQDPLDRGFGRAPATGSATPQGPSPAAAVTP